MKSKLLIAIATLLASSIISAEQGNYILGPIDDAPIEIAVPEVSEDGRPAGVPAEAKHVRMHIDNIGSDGYALTGAVWQMQAIRPYELLHGSEAPE